MRRTLVCLVIGLVGLVAHLNATDSRIIALGRHDNFFMDDYSIFRNPANISIYPNLLIGSGGYFAQEDDPEELQNTANPALKRVNRDPVSPYAGGIISYSFNQSTESGSQYPMFSIGAVFNRYDRFMDYLLQDTEEFAEAFREDSALILPTPVGKFDVLAGWALKNGSMFGVGAYLAFQKESYGTLPKEIESSLFRLNLGANIPVAQAIDFEASLGVGGMNLIGVDTSGGTQQIKTLADIGESDFILNADLRLFSALASINGEFVPHFGLTYIDITQYDMFEAEFGLGATINIDKGFGWAGLDIIYLQEDNDGIGGRISFGLERNLLWDWFLLRAGVSKKLMFVETADGDGKWIENAEADASDDDFLGIGIGFNVENRLKIDCVIAEDVFYTFTNLISAPQHHLLTRFSISYSF
ncbi:MAG: hypothetical protein GF398_04595 [Chitinivibrionales bacterium]|nr:hypothetical protein [Chitinivibrionales bacterium]